MTVTVVQSTRVFLEARQVFAGMTVALCLEGKTDPEQDEKGQMLFRVMSGGVPNRVKFYPIEGISAIPNDSGKKAAVVAQSIDLNGFKSTVRFMPTETFLPTAAPPNTEFVVWDGRELLRYPNGRNVVRLRADARGQVTSCEGYQYDFYDRPYPLPPQAILIPISRIGQ